MKHLASIAAFSSLIAFAAADALAAGGPVGMTNPAGRPVGLDHALIRMSPQGLANQQGSDVPRGWWSWSPRHHDRKTRNGPIRP